MTDPFKVLGVQIGADPDEIRAAYRKKALTCHPDRFQDLKEKEAAHERMTRLNLAYEEALKMATVRQQAAYHQELPRDEALQLALRMLNRDNPRSALRQLNRSDSKNAEWYHIQGQVFMALEEFEKAEIAFRQAIKMKPENNVYRAAALDANVAARKANTLQGKLKKLFQNIKK